MYIENLLANLSFCLLFCTMIFYWVQAIFFSNKNFVILGNFGMLCSNFCLVSLLLFRWQNSGHFPLSNLYESLIFLSWGITAIHLILYQVDKNSHKEKKESRYQNIFLSLWLGCVTSPTALFINTFASFSLPPGMQQPSALVPALQSNWLFMHVTVMILSYAALIIGCLLSFVFLIITRGEEINLKKSLFKNFFLNSMNITSFFRNLFSNNYIIDSNNYKKFFLIEKFIGKNLIFIQTNFLILQEKNKKALISISNKTKYFFSFITIKNSTINKNYSSLFDKWLDTLNLCLSSKLQLSFFLIKLPSYSINEENMSLSFSTERPIINIENKIIFQKIYNSEEELKRKLSKNNKNLTYKIAKNLDNLSYRILGIGFPFLTIGILSGSVWANEAWGSYWSWDPKETWALLTWLVFAVYFHSRLIKGWEGKKPAILATLGFIVVWICFIGVNLLKSGLHSYGFFS